MANEDPATQSGGQPEQPTQNAGQAPQTRTYTPEEVNQIVSQRVGQVVRERNQLRQQVQQFQTAQQDQGPAASSADDGEDDEKFFRGIVREEVQGLIQPIKQDFARTRAREELSNYFGSKGSVPADVKQEIEQTYLDLVDQGYADQVGLQDVVRGVIGARMEQDFFNRQSAAQTSNADAEAAARSAQAEGSNTAPPNTGVRDWESLSDEEMEKELREKGFDLTS